MISCSAEPAKVEPQPADSAKPVEENPKPPLQTASPEREAELERKIRSVLARAAADLGRINYQALNIDARTQYDQARRFVSQAEDALRARNLVFAENLAGKAAALATQLAGG